MKIKFKDHNQKYAMWDALVSIATQTKITSYMEIGVKEGWSLERVIRNSRNLEFIVLCDTWGKEYGRSNRLNHDHIDKLLKDLNYTGKVKYLDGDSKETIHTLAQRCLCYHSFDLITVDGDHSHEGALTDLNNTWSYLFKNRLLVFDDIIHRSHSYLNDTVNEFLKDNEFMEEIYRNTTKQNGVVVMRRV